MRSRQTIHAIFAALIAGVAIVGGTAAIDWLAELDQRVAHTFESGPWEIPARVYAAPLTLHPGLDLERTGFRQRLGRLRYREVTEEPTHPGEVRIGGERTQLYLRGFAYPGTANPQRRIAIATHDGVIERITDLDSRRTLTAVELEPELLSSIDRGHRSKRRVLSLAVVPPRLRHAVLTVEDRRFYDHPGVDLRGVARAIVANLSGRPLQGGSTISQQLAKNLFLTHERSLGRKLREVFLALILEHRYTKDQILQAYLNEIYFGQDGASEIHGIWEAAQYYFSRSPDELSLGQVATLAGIIHAPNRYHPARHPERARRRRNVVLGQLAEVGAITAAERAAATAEPILEPPPVANSAEAPYFVDFVRRRALASLPSDTVSRAGIDLFTTLDSELQHAAEEAVTNGIRRLRSRANSDACEAALVALHPRTGAVLAMVGGSSYRDSQYNRAVDARRQPGSVFKPIVFLAAFDRANDIATAPSTLLVDAPFDWTYDGRVWSPHNYRDIYFGEVSARRALALSLNTATARLAQEIGLQPIVDTAAAVGIDRPLPALPAISLGAIEVSPIEVAEAYASIANHGVHIEPRVLRKVVTGDGRLLPIPPPQISRATTAGAAYLVTDMLRTTIDDGTGRGARELGFALPAAGKTGTSNDGRDAWFAGYTPELVAVVWVGSDRGRALGRTGAEAALPIWTEFMQRATAGVGPDFAIPSDVVAADIDPLTGQHATEYCPHAVREIFLPGRLPKRTCQLHDPWM